MTPDFRDETAVEETAVEETPETQETQADASMPAEDDNPGAVSEAVEANDERQF